METCIQILQKEKERDDTIQNTVEYRIYENIVDEKENEILDIIQRIKQLN